MGRERERERGRPKRERSEKETISLSSSLVMVVSTNFSRAFRVAAKAKPYAFNLRASSSHQSSYLRTPLSASQSKNAGGAHAYRKRGGVGRFAARGTNRMCITTTT